MKKITSFCGLILAGFSAAAQDPSFLNTNQSLINVNPSFAGSNGYIRNQFSYRNEYPNLSGNFVSYNNAFDMYVNGIKGGIALSAQHEGRGNYITNKGLGIAYAQHVAFSDGDNKLIPSAQVFYRQRQTDFSSLAWQGGTIPPVIVDYVDLNAGLLFTHRDRLFIGMSLFHLNTPHLGNFNSTGLDVRYLMHASYNMPLNESTILQVMCNGSNQYSYTDVQFGANIVHKRLIIGSGCTTGGPVYLNAGYRANVFIVSLGYDVNFSRLVGNTAGSWEVHMSYNLRDKDHRKSLTSFEKM